MHKLVPPLIGLTVSGFFLYQAARNMPQPLADETPSTTTALASQAGTAHEERHSAESPHAAVMQFLTDMDDLLDTVHDRASFAAIQPQLLARARKHAALAAQHANQGLTQLSPAGARQFQAAANRHTESLGRAIQAVREVEAFFAHDMATILSPR
jgi:hypothetical protein